MRKQIYGSILTALVAIVTIIPSANAQSFSSFILSGKAGSLARGDISFVTPDLASGKVQAAVSYGQWAPAGMKYGALQAGGFFAATDNLGIRLDYRNNMFSAFDVIDANGNLSGTVKPSEQRILAGVSLRFADKFFIDVDAKYLMADLGSGKSSCFGGDLGVSLHENGMTVGLKLADLGTKYSFGHDAYSLPMRVQAGGSYKMEFASVHALTLGADLGYILPEEYHSFVAAAGLEYAFNQLVFVRAGYRYATAVAPSFASFGLGFAFKGIGLDAAYLLGPVSNAWTLSVKVTL
ncbi:MAG: PorV/PorQ family protein [Bacteroidales bacterium]|nr:PorV/PorQ family protein [Bacteroidales bacterium]